jgi:uncharacterized RDD family membrane protein YckC
MAQDMVILSPEKTVLTYRLAGIGSRVLAHLLDLTVLGAVIAIVGTLVGTAFPQMILLLMPCFTLGPFVYFILMEGLCNGRTLGKWAFGLRVAMADGRPVTFAAALGRNLLRPADMLPGTYFVGLLAIFTNPCSRRIGDLVAQTVVLHNRRALPKFTPAPHVLGLHPLEAYVGELRGMTNDEYLALRRFCDRFPELPTSVQDKLIRELWRPVALRRAVPSLPNVHELYLAEAVVMKYGRMHGLL